MNGRPIDPGERRPGADADADAGVEEITGELNRYVSISDADPSPDFAARVMTAVEAVPPPKRGLIAALANASRLTRTLQLTAAAAVVVLAIAGTIAGGQLAGLIRQSATPVTTPTSVASPSPSPTPTPSSSERDSTEPSRSPQPSQEEGGFPSAEPSQSEEPSSAGDSGSPQPSGSDDHEASRTSPGPTADPQASEDH